MKELFNRGTCQKRNKTNLNVEYLLEGHLFKSVKFHMAGKTLDTGSE